MEDSGYLSKDNTSSFNLRTTTTQGVQNAISGCGGPQLFSETSQNAVISCMLVGIVTLMQASVYLSVPFAMHMKHFLQCCYIEGVLQ